MKDRERLRTLRLAHPEKDYLAATWNNKIVMITGWWIAGWMIVEYDNEGFPVFTPYWKATILELPDRTFSEKELERL